MKENNPFEKRNIIRMSNKLVMPSLCNLNSPTFYKHTYLSMIIPKLTSNGGLSALPMALNMNDEISLKAKIYLTIRQ